MDDGGSAFPFEERYQSDPSTIYATHHGMSMRDWFAGKAMPIAATEYTKNGIKDWKLKAMFGDRSGITAEEIIARLSYDLADAMIVERKRISK